MAALWKTPTAPACGSGDLAQHDGAISHKIGHDGRSGAYAGGERRPCGAHLDVRWNAAAERPRALRTAGSAALSAGTSPSGAAQERPSNRPSGIRARRAAGEAVLPVPRSDVPPLRPRVPPLPCWPAAPASRAAHLPSGFPPPLPYGRPLRSRGCLRPSPDRASASSTPRPPPAPTAASASSRRPQAPALRCARPATYRSAARRLRTAPGAPASARSPTVRRPAPDQGPRG